MAKTNAERQAEYRARRAERMEDRIAVELPVDVRHALVEMADYHGVYLKEIIISLVRNAFERQYGKTTQKAYQDYADKEAQLFLEEIAPKKR